MPQEPHSDTPGRLSAPLLDGLSAGESSTSLYILWGFFAFAAMAAAAAICFTPGADRRFSAAVSGSSNAASLARLEVARPLPPVAQAPAPAPPRQDDALASRLQSLEEQIEILTGSISKATTNTGITPSMPPPLREQAGAPAPAPAPAQQETAPLAAAEPPPQPLPDSRAMFALDLGSEASFGAMRVRWEQLRRQHPELARLTPRVSVRDARGKVELRLIAGPFETAAEAARACSSLLAKGAECDGGLYDGQRLPAS